MTILAADGGPPRWQLSPEEAAKGARIGQRRYEASRKDRRGQSHGREAKDPETEVALDVLGAKGELAAARILGLGWPAHVDTFKREPDIYPDIEVRTVQAGDNRRLIVRSDDAPERIYVLIEAWPAEEYVLLGAIRGHRARRPEWQDDPAGREPAWFVPREALRPLIRRAEEAAPAPRPAVVTSAKEAGAVKLLVTCHWCHEQIEEDFTLVRDDAADKHWRAHGRHVPAELAHAMVGGDGGPAPDAAGVRDRPG